MNISNNKKKTSLFKAAALLLVAAVSFTFASCDDDMDIQQSYPFTVETMPVPNKMTKGQTVEIRCELKRRAISPTRSTPSATSSTRARARCEWTTASRSCPTTATCSKTTSSACITHRSATRRRTSSSWWRTISGTPTSWNLTSTTGM